MPQLVILPTGYHDISYTSMQERDWGCLDWFCWRRRSSDVGIIHVHKVRLPFLVFAPDGVCGVCLFVFDIVVTNMSAASTTVFM